MIDKIEIKATVDFSVIYGNRIIVIDNDGFKKWLSQIIPGTELKLIISQYRKSRSTGKKSANHHLNGHIVQIMDEMGETDFDYVKTLVKEGAIVFGYPFRETKQGTKVFKSESKCNSLECSWLIESAHIIAGNLGIKLIESEYDK